MESIKEELSEELSEELEKEEYSNPFEYDENELIDIVDDTWITADDRDKLINHLKSSCNLEFPWADKSLLECIIKKKYYVIVKTMNKDQYTQDKLDPLKSAFNL